ncbi:hypothetical protein MY4824_009872 [Beauveria thailandica]
MTPPTSTPATARPRRTVLRWKSVEVIFLLSLLLEAKRDNLLNTTKNLLDPVFQSIADKMTTNFPRRPFTMENIRSKFNDFRRLWLIFLEAESTPGTTINHEEGTLNMSDVNIQKIVDVHGDIVGERYSRRILLEADLFEQLIRNGDKLLMEIQMLMKLRALRRLRRGLVAQVVFREDEEVAEEALKAALYRPRGSVSLLAGLPARLQRLLAKCIFIITRFLARLMSNKRSRIFRGWMGR